MAEYIEREKVCLAINRNLIDGDILSRYDDGRNDGIIISLAMVENASAADVRPERHSEWVENNGTFECRKCSYAFEHEGYVHFFSYCPCCGAKMERKRGMI